MNDNLSNIPGRGGDGVIMRREVFFPTSWERSGFATKAAHRENDQADEENKSDTSTAVSRPAEVKAAAAQQDKQNEYDQ